MGTEVQSKMYFPGYYSIQNLSSNVGHGSWSLLHENRNLKNGQQYEVFLTRPVLDGFHGCDKEQLRQTILKHESIFKHQLNELHRLYERQKDLMNEIKSKELLKHQNAAGTSQSTFSSSGFPTEDNRKSWHISNLPLVDASYGGQSTSSTCISQSPCDSIGKTLQKSGVPSQSRVGMKDHESLDSRGKKPRRRLFNLELPADEYLSDEEEPEGGLGPVTGKSDCNNRSSSGLHLVKSKCLTDLNEPIQIDKVSASSSVVMSGSHPSSKEEIERQALSANAYKGVWPFAKKFPENPQVGKDGRVHDLHLKNEIQKEWSTNALKAEQISSSGGKFGLQDFNKPCESSENEARISCDPPAKLFTSDQNKMEKRIKRTLFGIEISECDISSSAMALQSVAAISQSSPNWTKPPSSLSQNLTSIQVSTSVNTSTQSNRASIMMPQSREVTRDRLLLDCNSIPSTPSLKDEVSHQSGFLFRAKLEANDLQACDPSRSLARQGNHSSLGDRVDAKSAIDVNDVPPSTYLHGVACEQNIISLNGLRHQESRQGRLHWLETVPLCNGKSSNESEGSHQLKINSLQNHSKQFENRADLRNGRSQSLIPDSSSLICGHDAENGYSARIALDKSDMVQDPVSRTCREQLKADGLVQDKGFSNGNSGSRHQIDLNRCLTEEETEMTAASPIMRTGTVIDLEAPVMVETDLCGEDSIERRRKEPLDSPHEGLIKVAAEALVAISSSQAPAMQENATCRNLEASENDSLLWFAEVISSHDGNLDNGNAAEVKRTSCDEEVFPVDMDYFEHMTLNLVETKEEQPCYVPPNSDNLIEEVTLSKRPRRGQSRRGRQRKDFRRDVLPGLASLSKNEVTDDLQIIEGLIRESGGSWQSSLSQRNSGKGGRGRGRKRMGTSAPSTTIAEVSQPQIEQPKCEELQGPEERNLTCWGKRTRRPPRQRYPIDNSPIPQK